ncbi:hypothetical protein SAMN05421736_101768 [Evansella caseinilytica]|uniref:Uncharacterized protein n=1 Tax=Evansella caseinilytica TaxID=1503961 RepID=A0A1H3IB83_9BACI|nr:hypothetical protein [Evansella caseinilytica]SDY24772.1 hypothetical protein SAMN05421736_101768 [Evansella caseinilytica]
MIYKKSISGLTFIVAVLGATAAAAGIFSTGGPGEFQLTSVRGDVIDIYGKGLYRHMSADVAIQGIAQDWITLFLAVPLLLASLFFAGKGSFRARLMLSGTLLYFFITYLLYLVMAMYNPFFLGYVVLLCASFFALALSIISLNAEDVAAQFQRDLPVNLIGGFLLFTAAAVASMWLSVVVPHLSSGTIPPEAAHYTTLPVQGLDLALFLPLCFVSAILFMRRKPFGYVCAPVYLFFLLILMTALTAKIIGMALTGSDPFPAIIIIPAINAAAAVFTVLTLKKCQAPSVVLKQ